MSWDCEIIDNTGAVAEVSEAHSISGGTFALGGTNALWLNVTWNYTKHYIRVMGGGLQTLLDGKRVSDTLDILRAGMDALGKDVDEDYWKATEGNARLALENLIALGEMLPSGTWKVS